MVTVGIKRIIDRIHRGLNRLSKLLEKSIDEILEEELEPLLEREVEVVIQGVF